MLLPSNLLLLLTNPFKMVGELFEMFSSNYKPKYSEGKLTCSELGAPEQQSALLKMRYLDYTHKSVA